MNWQETKLTVFYGAAICVLLLASFPSDLMAAETSGDSQASSHAFDYGQVISPPASRSFSLSLSFDKADQYNKEIASAKWNLAIVKAGIRIASAIPNPQFQLQTGFGPSFTKLFTGQTMQAGWTEQLLTAGKRAKKISLARANYVLSELQLNALRFDVHNRVRRTYAELAAAEAYADLVEAQRRVGLELSEIARKRVEAGRAAQSEVLQANLNVLQFDTLRNQAQGRLQQASAALMLITGEKPEHIDVLDVDDNGLFKLSAQRTEIVPSPSLSMPPLSQLCSTAQSERPDLKATQEQVLVSRKALTLARAQRFPDLFVGSGFTFSTWSKNQPAGLVAQPNWLGHGVFMNVTTENPIFYQHQGEIAQAASNVRLAERQQDFLGAQVATDTVLAYNSVLVARRNIFLFQEDLLPTAADVARLARRGYQVGASDLATAIVAQQQYQQTLSSYFDAVVAYQNAWADLEKAVGVPLHY